MVRWLSFIHYARSGKLRAISRKPFDPPFPLRASANFCELLRASAKIFISYVADASRGCAPETQNPSN